MVVITLISVCGGRSEDLQIETVPPKARVIIAENAGATKAFQPNESVVREMVKRGLLQFSGKVSVTEFWKSLLTTQDVVGIKVFSAPGAISGTRSAVVAPIVQSLLDAGISPKKIILWDKHFTDLRAGGFDVLARRLGVRIAGASESGFDDKNFYESPILGNLVFGDLEFGKKNESLGRKSFVSKLVSQQITKIISITPLLNHNQASVTGHIFSSAFGSVDNTIRFDTERLPTVLPEIYALPSISDHVILNITDALIAQYEGEQRTLLHYSKALNQIWFSKDPVALDLLSIEELERQRVAIKAPSPKSHLEIYHNASLLELGVSDTKKVQIEMVGDKPAP